MKSILRYSLLAGIAALAVLMIIFYQEYMGEDTDPATENQANPVIYSRLNAIVTDTASRKARPNSAVTSLKITYTDIDTKEVASFQMNYHSQPAIAIGDTVTKDKGEKLLLLYKKGGTIVTVPIE
ncbi:hypothetical protein [Spirosoma endophyticum]|uniref:Uncharacterized protein n=1 Tax=Spirosoma endophyticum TaxID=662367 RepID=A0A1I1F4H2_9BACT|nr:hypothetical protein [Spirosoma endophyticum]SFB94214.1 hypothetical protein SAMN05216167_101148 [Spirosoma endophyticum]